MRTGSIILFLVGLIGIGCIDQIDLNIPTDRTDAFFIDGSLVLGGATSRVQLTFSRVYDFTNESRDYVQTAMAQVIDGEGNAIELLRKDATSFVYDFEVDSPFFPTVGGKYMLRIELDDGRVIQSDFSTILEMTPPTSIEQKIVERRAVAKPNEPGNVRIIKEILLSVNAQIPEGASLIWLLNKVYELKDSPWPYQPGPDYELTRKTCYLTERVSINRINVLSDRDIVGNQVTDFPISSDQISFQYNQGLFYLIQQRAVDNETADYLKLLDQLINVGDNVFDERPGELNIGNISVLGESDTKVYGHFYAAQDYLVRVKADESLYEERELYCPLMAPCDGGICCWGVCCDCLNHPSSTLIKPNWWIE